MKYRNITLNGNKNKIFSLVKYTDTDEYKHFLDNLKKLNPELAESVEKCPKLYSELSEHQSYMILRGNYSYNCVGAIIIGTSTDEKNLEIKVQLDEKYFSQSIDMLALIDQLTDSLGLYFFDKENIEIEFLNGLDLSQYSRYRYSKKVYDENLTTYTYQNKYYNSLIPTLIDEIEETEKNLTEWKQSWMQKINMSDDYDMYNFNEELMKEYEKGTVSLNELFFKAESLMWLGINSNKAERTIQFSRNGAIQLNKKSKKLENGINYEFSYNILRKGFDFKTCGYKNNGLQIEDNPYFTNIKYQNLNLLYSKSNNRSCLRFITPKVNDSSIGFELWINENNEIERCYVDFRTHKKSNGKVNGLYALRIFPKYNMIKLNYISRNGMKYSDMSNQICENNEELYSSVFNENITMELLNKLVQEIIPIINRRSVARSKQIIDPENSNAVIQMENIQENAINFIKQIKGEIPLPHLQERLNTFIEEHERRNNPELVSKENNSPSLSLVDSPIISENEEPVYTDAFTKVKRPRDSYIVKSRSIYGRKK